MKQLPLFDAGQWAMILLLFLLSFVLLFLFIREWRKVHRLNKRKHQIGWSHFRKAASSWRLPSDQLDLLEKMLRHHRIDDADTIFSNASLFETVVDRWLSKKERQQGDQLIRSLRDSLGFGQLPPSVQLVSSRQLTAGERVSINFRSNDKPVQTVIDQLDDFSWSVRAVPLHQPNPFDLVVVHYTRAGDGEYRIVACVQESNPKQIVFYHSMEFEHFQMRSWVRIDLSLAATISGSAPNSDRDVRQLKEQAVWLIDLSGGGASFKTPESFVVGEKVLLSFQLLSHDFTQIKTEVVRVQKESPLQTISVEFLDLSTEAREKLVRFIFDRQRLMRS